MPATTTTAPALDPVLARAQFFFDLELNELELRLTVPQAPKA